MKLSKQIFNFVLPAALIVALCGYALARRGHSATQNQLANTHWRLSSFGSSGSLTSVIQGTTITLKLGADGRVSGNSGCNNYAGEFQVQGDNISFSRLLSTKRACINQGANQQETRYLAALESANRFQLRDARLTIHYGDGRNTLNFVDESAAPAPGAGTDSPLTVIASFYDALNARDYERAHRLWENPPQTFEDFVRGYADTTSVKILANPKPTVEGAAGSLYAEIPTILLVRRRDGRDRVFAGCYVMRKSNLESSDGRSQNSWRIYRGKFSPASTAQSIPALLNQACRN